MEPSTPSENGKTWATMAYVGQIVGLPLFIGPLIARDDPFALYHAKHAFDVVVEILLFLAVAAMGAALSVPAFFLTCGLSNLVVIPLAMLLIVVAVPCFWIPSIHGAWLAQRGEWRAPFGTFGFGERLFLAIEVRRPDGIG